MISSEQAEKIKNELHRRRKLLETRLTALKERKSSLNTRRKNRTSSAQSLSKKIEISGTKVRTGGVQAQPTQAELKNARAVAEKLGISVEMMKEMGLS